MDMAVGGISITRPGFVGPDSSLSTEININNGSTINESSGINSDVYDTVSQNTLRINQSELNV